LSDNRAAKVPIAEFYSVFPSILLVPPCLKLPGECRAKALAFFAVVTFIPAFPVFNLAAVTVLILLRLRSSGF
jgi:hypothetical protein